MYLLSSIFSFLPLLSSLTRLSSRAASSPKTSLIAVELYLSLPPGDSPHVALPSESFCFTPSGYSSPISPGIPLKEQIAVLFFSKEHKPVNNMFLIIVLLERPLLEQWWRWELKGAACALIRDGSGSALGPRSSLASLSPLLHIPEGHGLASRAMQPFERHTRVASVREIT